MAGDRVSVRAVSAPVAEILERLARATGMRVVYDGPVPRQILTATLEARAPAAAVLSVLEGLGLNYALVMDRSGARVDQLLILGAVAPGASPLSSPPVARRGLPIVQPESPEELLESLQEDPDPEQAESDEGDEFVAQPPDQPPPEPAGPRHPGPPPPNYPSSSFTPKLPQPTPAPVPSPQASPPPPQRQ